MKIQIFANNIKWLYFLLSGYSLLSFDYISLNKKQFKEIGS